MNLKTDRNYETLRLVWSTLDKKFDYNSAPTEVIGLILDAKDLLEDALRIYEENADETDAENKE